MKTKQEQIEEMQKTICANCKDKYSKKGYVCPWQDKDTKCYNCEKLSEALYNAGYRLEATLTYDFIKMAQTHAVQDFADKVKAKSYVNDYCREVVEIEKIDELLKEY